MAEISKIKVGNTNYDIQDQQLREEVSTFESSYNSRMSAMENTIGTVQEQIDNLIIEVQE